jgi:hypothetical protein
MNFKHSNNWWQRPSDLGSGKAGAFGAETEMQGQEQRLFNEI